MKILSSKDPYKLPICHFLSSLTYKMNDHGQDNLKINTLIREIICQILLNTPNNITKLETLEIIYNFSVNNRNDIATNILKFSGDMETTISRYLQKHAKETSFDKKYLKLLEGFAFQHECVKWRQESELPAPKKLKIEEKPAAIEGRSKWCVETDDNRSLDCENREKKYTKREKLKEVKANVECDENKDDSVGDVIKNIRGEIKCLTNILKTEKMTPKNAADLKTVASQIMSLL